MEVDTSRWSGEGTFTRALIEQICEFPEVTFLRVEDRPASAQGGHVSFISNELFVAFKVQHRVEWRFRLGVPPFHRQKSEPVMTLGGLEAALTAAHGLGPPDYADESMLQYLRTERIVPPYQTRGINLVELVRIYEVGTEPRR